MKPVVSILPALLVLCASTLYAQSTDPTAPGATFALPPQPPPVLPDTTPKYKVVVAKKAAISARVDLNSVVEQLYKQPLDKSDSEWREIVDPQKYRVANWNRTIRSVREKNGQVEITVLASLFLTDDTERYIAAGSSTEVYRLLPNGEVELAKRTPHKIAALAW